MLRATNSMRQKKIFFYWSLHCCMIVLSLINSTLTVHSPIDCEMLGLWLQLWTRQICGMSWLKLLYSTLISQWVRNYHRISHFISMLNFTLNATGWNAKFKEQWHINFYDVKWSYGVQKLLITFQLVGSPPNCYFTLFYFTAIRAYQQVNNVSMIYALNQIKVNT